MQKYKWGNWKKKTKPQNKQNQTIKDEMLPLSLDLHCLLLQSIYLPIKPSLLREMVIHKSQLFFFLFFETKPKIANVIYKYIFISCWQSNHYVHFNQYCSLRDSPHLKLYEINICTLTYIPAAQERNIG